MRRSCTRPTSTSRRWTILVVWGENPLERDGTAGRWRVMQCARGSFQRMVPPQRPTIASTSALRKRSTSSMKPIDGISSSSAVIEAIW